MGAHQQFCLRWNNHQSNMLSVFDDLFQNEALVDVTLACEGLSIKAHKMVLSACSPYFQSLFLDNPCKHPIVILKDIHFSDLKALMDFMYKGEVNVSQEQLSTLLKTAETLKVRGLTEVAGGGEIQNSILTQPGLIQQHLQLASHHPVVPRSPMVPQPLLNNSLPQQTQPPQQSPAPQPQQHQQQTQLQAALSQQTSMQLGLGNSDRSTSPPLAKRKKTRHRSQSSQSDICDDDAHEIQELIEPKVEITTEDSMEEDRRLGNGTTGVSSTDNKICVVRSDSDLHTGTNNTHGSPSTSGSPNADTQNFAARNSNVASQNATPPLLFNHPPQQVGVGQQPPLAAVQAIGQPQVLQSTSQGRDRQFRKWNEATLAEAMEAVRCRKMSIIAACRQFEIPWGTLYRRLSLANIRSPYARNEQNSSTSLPSTGAHRPSASSGTFSRMNAGHPLLDWPPAPHWNFHGSSSSLPMSSFGRLATVRHGSADVVNDEHGSQDKQFKTNN